MSHALPHYKKTVVSMLLLFITHSFLHCQEKGLSYRSIQQTDPFNLAIHILTIDPSIYSVDLVKAHHQREPVLDMVTAAGAVAGINAGFYRRGGEYNGYPIGLRVINGICDADPGLKRGALCFDGQRLFIRHGNFARWVIAPSLDLSIIIDRYNDAGGADELVLYDHVYKITPTLPGALYLIVDASTQQILEVTCSDRGVFIKETTTVLCVGPAHPQRTVLEQLSPFDPIQVLVEGGPFKDCHFVVDGAGTLIMNKQKAPNEMLLAELSAGNRIRTFGDEASADFSNKEQAQWLIHKRHPRTAAGIQEKGNILFVVVDGRNTSSSEGLTLEELATLMLDLGCRDAINLGGGGCSTMVIAEHGVVNVPSGDSNQKGKGQRPVSDALVVRKK